MLAFWRPKLYLALQAAVAVYAQERSSSSWLSAVSASCRVRRALTVRATAQQNDRRQVHCQSSLCSLQTSAVWRTACVALTPHAACQVDETHLLDVRQVLGGLLAGIAILGSSQKAMAIDIEDERNKSRMKGYDLIYEAREIELPQNVRDGLSQVRQSSSWLQLGREAERWQTCLPFWCAVSACNTLRLLCPVLALLLTVNEDRVCT